MKPQDPAGDIARIPQTILVVEDDLVVNHLLCRAVRQAGYQVLSAANGLEALDCLNRHAVDLILSDLVMPQLDGVALSMRVRAEPAWAHIPLVILSAANTRAFPPDLATRIIQKPLALNDLERLLQDLLPGRA
jgi:two-component system response regulator VicR